MINTKNIQVTPKILNLIAQIDECKSAWRLLGTLEPERLHLLKHIATVESIASSTRIEGSTLSDKEVEALLTNLNTERFRTRDEQEIAGYAMVMETIFQSYQDIPITENHIK